MFWFVITINRFKIIEFLEMQRCNVFEALNMCVKGKYIIFQKISCLIPTTVNKFEKHHEILNRFYVLVCYYKKQARNYMHFIEMQRCNAFEALNMCVLKVNI